MNHHRPDHLLPGPGHLDQVGQAGRGLSRRHLLLGGLGLSATATLLSACGGDTNGSAAPTAAATGTAKKGGTLRIARPLQSSGESLDPASPLCAYEYLGALYNRLVKMDQTSTPIPDLATAWSSSPDAMTWTLQLRSDVGWHDGKPFTSADAKYTLEHILDAKTDSPQAGVLSPFLKPSDISTPDAHTLVLNLSSPNAEFISLLTHYNCYVIPDGSGAVIGKTGIGTGPFKLAKFTPAGTGTVVANPDYFDGAPTLDTIEMIAIGEIQSRVSSLLGGQVDLISQTSLDTASAKQVQASSTCTTASVKDAQMYVMPMLFTAAPFQSLDVRRAFKMAYDPEAVLKLAVGGQGTVAHDNPIPPSNANHLDYAVTPDPEQAASLLKKAGVDVSKQQLYVSSIEPVLNPMGLAYQGSVKDAGIGIDLQTAAADSYYTNVWMKKPFMTSYWYTGRPVDQQLNELLRSGSGYNETAWADPTYDGILDAARAETDDAKRRVHYQDAQKYLVDNSPEIIPMFGDRIVGMSKKVLNYSEYGFEFDYLKIGLSA